MKKVLTGIFLVIDLVLLVVIISSLIKPKEQEPALQDEKYEVAKEDTQKDSSDKSPQKKKSMEEARDSEEEAAPTEEATDYSDTEEATEYYDTEGIEGIVDIEDEDISEENIEDMPAPSLADFMWYYNGVYYNGVPDDAELVLTKDELRGAWKAFFWFGHDVSGSYDAMEFANVMLEPGDNTVEVSMKMCQLYIPNSEVIDEADDPIHTYSGTWDGNGIHATGAGNIHITTFYEMSDGHQYALGTFDAPDGTPTVIALVRP